MTKTETIDQVVERLATNRAKARFIENRDEYGSEEPGFATYSIRNMIDDTPMPMKVEAFLDPDTNVWEFTYFPI